MEIKIKIAINLKRIKIHNKVKDNKKYNNGQ